ncbi:hypothetical protein O1R50_09195 [Glycomyces luteolus]|uniref:Uncharacterized protein n=1 Tax=Glycomyces luteolus TaxID=2670330 RepID=A0A9X3P7P5_9ACTN|nr:hypothetical protein [Glycomyces luteolus]MDA1359797.1 hypothetical protein [Glycomyces luteolus]
MITDNLCTALRIWTGPAQDRLAADDTRTRVPGIIACWEDGAGQISTSLLPTATAALQAHLGHADLDPEQRALPTDWPKAASDFTALMRDIVMGEPWYLAGIGLVTRTTAATGQHTMCIQIAADRGTAFTYERHDSGSETRLRFDVGDPLWWDQQAVLEPLERYRAAATGWPPVLPEADPAHTEPPRAHAGPGSH